jgi:hypothetical protein
MKCNITFSHVAHNILFFCVNQAEGSSSKRYNTLANQCRAVNPSTDLATFVRSVVGGSGSGPGGGGGSVLTIPSSFNKFTFIPPRNPPPGSVSCSQHDIQV